MISKSGIYQIQSKIKPERIYIGSAVHFRSRKRQHFSDMRLGKHKNIKLQRHFDKYGEEDLVFSLLFNCDVVDLLKNEQFFIDALDPWFNINKVAGSNLGHKMSEEVVRKNRERNLGKPSPMNGKHHTEEAKGKMSVAKTGKSLPHTKEWNEKIGLALKGKPKSPEAVAKRVLKMKGRKQSPESIAKRLKSVVGQKRTDETRRKMSEAQLNLPPEVKRSIKLAQRKLPPSIVELIREEACNAGKTGLTYQQIGEIYGVSKAVVFGIKSGRTYSKEF